MKTNFSRRVAAFVSALCLVAAAAAAEAPMTINALDDNQETSVPDNNNDSAESGENAEKSTEDPAEETSENLAESMTENATEAPAEESEESDADSDEVASEAPAENPAEGFFCSVDVKEIEKYLDDFGVEIRFYDESGIEIQGLDSVYDINDGCSARFYMADGIEIKKFIMGGTDLFKDKEYFVDESSNKYYLMYDFTDESSVDKFLDGNSCSVEAEKSIIVDENRLSFDENTCYYSGEISSDTNVKIGEKLNSDSKIASSNTPENYEFVGYCVNDSEKTSDEITVDKNVESLTLIFKRKCYYLKVKCPKSGGTVESAGKTIEVDGDGNGKVEFDINEHGELEIKINTVDSNYISSVLCMLGDKPVIDRQFDASEAKKEYSEILTYDDSNENDFDLIVAFGTDSSKPVIDFSITENDYSSYNKDNNTLYANSHMKTLEVSADITDEGTGVDEESVTASINGSTVRGVSQGSGKFVFEFKDLELTGDSEMIISASDLNGNISRKSCSIVLDMPQIKSIEFADNKVCSHEGEFYYIQKNYSDSYWQIEVKIGSESGVPDAGDIKLMIGNTSLSPTKVESSPYLEWDPNEKVYKHIYTVRFSSVKGSAFDEGRYDISCEVSGKTENQNIKFTGGTLIKDKTAPIQNAEIIINGSSSVNGKTTYLDDVPFGIELDGVDEDISGVKELYAVVYGKNGSRKCRLKEDENGYKLSPESKSDEDAVKAITTDSAFSIKFYAADNCGNINEYYELFADPEKSLYIDTEAPKAADAVVKFSRASDYFAEKNNIVYFEDKVKISVSVNDAGKGSGISSVCCYINGSSSKKAMTLENGKWTCIINQSELNSSGENTVKIQASDKVGNTGAAKEIKTRIVVDGSRPSGSITFTNLTGNSHNGSKDSWTQEHSSAGYNNFSNSSVEVSISASDENGINTSGIKSIKYMIYDNSGDPDEAIPGGKKLESIDKWQNYSGKFNISESISHLYVRIEDNVGHVSYLNSDGVIVDTESGKPDIEIYGGNDKEYYNNSVPLRIHVSDPVIGSGIDHVDYYIMVDGDVRSSGTWTMDYPDHSYSSILKNSRLERLVEVNENSNNVEVRIAAYDNAGNSSYSSKFLNIDTTAPSIKVEMSGSSDSGHSGYFKEGRTAEITVTERNFDASDIVLKVTKDGVSYSPSISGWTSSGTGDGRINTATVIFDDDGDYTFDIEYTDLAGNKAPEAEYGNKSADTSFTIDKTSPVINVSYDNNNASNENYYKDTRKGTVTITERNFDPSGADVQVMCNGKSVSTGSWSSSGDKNTLVFECGLDGEYTIKITDTDMAGNIQTKEFTDSFTVDTSKPEIKVTGVENKKAYSKENKLVPVIEISDETFDPAEYSYTLRLKNLNYSKESDLGSAKDVNEKGVKITYDELSHVLENDGIYTLTVKATDKAGNETSEEITFSVNCYGSTFYIMEDSETENLCENVYTNESIDIQVVEVNVEKPVEQSVSIVKDSEVIDCTDFSMDDSAEENEWFRRIYTINSANFADDAVYNVTVASTDRAGNTVTSVENMTGNDAGVSFIVDKTAPVISLTGIEDEGVYEETSRIVKITCSDKNCNSETLSLMMNGKELSRADYTVEDLGTELEVTLNVSDDGSGKKQKFEVGFADMAGNSTEVSVNDFILSAGLFRRILSNTPLMAGLAAVLVLGASGAVAAVKHNRKEN
ncbi:MAG: Ig-like domain-containing protein [Porcipelethomonas sp.]